MRILAAEKTVFRDVLQAADTRGATVYLTLSNDGGEKEVLFPIKQSTPAASNKALYRNTK